jgi:CRP/FNR family transcriptional regulator
MEKVNIRDLMNDLNERQKELNCLYQISSILKDNDEAFKAVLLKVVNIIPGGYRFPEICRVQIEVQDIFVYSEEFKSSELKQTAKIVVDGIEIGEINVFYIKPVKLDVDSVFLFDEQKLIHAIAEEIGQYVALKHFKEIHRISKEVSLKYNIPEVFKKWMMELALKESDIQEIINNSTDFKKGELIMKQGSPISYVFILTDGLLKLSIEDFRGRSFIFKLVKPLEMIGLSTLFGNAHYGFSVSAITPSCGYMVSQETLKLIIQKNQKFSNKLFKWYCDNLNDLYEKMNFLANKQALGRVSGTLLYLQKDIFEGQIIKNTITRKVIAELSSMSTENTVRILSELKKDGILKINKEGIQIVQYKLLETYSIAG